MKTIRIKKGFVLESVGGAYLACATGKLAKNFSALIRLNETGVFLWNKLTESNMAFDMLVDALIEEYGISREVAAADTERFVNSLKENGILE